jgi:hypothetical protein
MLVVPLLACSRPDSLYGARKARRHPVPGWVTPAVFRCVAMRVDTRTRRADDVVEALAKRLLEARTWAMHALNVLTGPAWLPTP